MAVVEEDEKACSFKPNNLECIDFIELFSLDVTSQLSINLGLMICLEGNHNLDSMKNVKQRIISLGYIFSLQSAFLDRLLNPLEGLSQSAHYWRLGGAFHRLSCLNQRVMKWTVPFLVMV